MKSDFPKFGGATLILDIEVSGLVPSTLLVPKKCRRGPLVHHLNYHLTVAVTSSSPILPSFIASLRDLCLCLVDDPHDRSDVSLLALRVGRLWSSSSAPLALGKDQSTRKLRENRCRVDLHSHGKP